MEKGKSKFTNSNKAYYYENKAKDEKDPKKKAFFTRKSRDFYNLQHAKGIVENLKMIKPTNKYDKRALDSAIYQAGRIFGNVRESQKKGKAQSYKIFHN